MRITVYVALDKCFCYCDVVVEISLHITFQIHINTLHSKPMHYEA